MYVVLNCEMCGDLLHSNRKLMLCNVNVIDYCPVNRPFFFYVFVNLFQNSLFPISDFAL